MPIDVQESGLNLILNACLFGLVAFALLSIVPWRLRDGRNRWTLWLPLAALIIYAVYETSMPARWDIRLDLVLIAPLLFVVLIAWLVRLVLLRLRRPK